MTLREFWEGWLAQMRRMAPVLLVMALMMLALVLFRERYEVGINLDHSLPWKVWWIEKGVPPAVGDFVAFRFRGDSPWFPKETMFVKQLVGRTGAVVEARRERGCLFYRVRLSWTEYAIGCFHEQAEGVRLHSGPVGRVPAGKLVVRGFDPASFDSRYAEVGWVDESAVVGRAVPLF